MIDRQIETRKVQQLIDRIKRDMAKMEELLYVNYDEDTERVELFLCEVPRAFGHSLSQIQDIYERNTGVRINDRRLRGILNSLGYDAKLARQHKLAGDTTIRAYGVRMLIDPAVEERFTAHNTTPEEMFRQDLLPEMEFISQKVLGMGNEYVESVIISLFNKANSLKGE